MAEFVEQLEARDVRHPTPLHERVPSVGSTTVR